MPNDRIPNGETSEKENSVILPKPQLMIIVNGDSVYKPGMKTYLVDKDSKKNKEQSVRGSEGKVIGGTVCTCNSVCTCNTQKKCTCNSQGGRRICSCNPVH